MGKVTADDTEEDVAQLDRLTPNTTAPVFWYQHMNAPGVQRPWYHWVYLCCYDATQRHGMKKGQAMTTGETPLQPLNSVEIWDAVDVSGTLYYALLNRDTKYRIEVWRRRANGSSERVWMSAPNFKCASVALAVNGRSLVIVYSRSSGSDSKTPYRPYIVTLVNIIS